MGWEVLVGLMIVDVGDCRLGGVGFQDPCTKVMVGLEVSFGLGIVRDPKYDRLWIDNAGGPEPGIRDGGSR